MIGNIYRFFGFQKKANRLLEGLNWSHLDKKEILTFDSHHQRKILFIPGINTIFTEENEEKYNASCRHEGTCFHRLFQTICERGYGVYMCNAYYLFGFAEIRSVMEYIEDFLKSPTGQEVEIIIGHSYGGLIANGLDLSKTQAKKVITVATPFGDKKIQRIAVPREYYFHKTKRPDIKNYNIGLESDHLVAPENTRYFNYPHKIIPGKHFFGLYMREYHEETIQEILDFAEIGK